MPSPKRGEADVPQARSELLHAIYERIVVAGTGIRVSQAYTGGQHPRPCTGYARKGGYGAPDRIRTCDLRLRRPTLYPLSYRRASRPRATPQIGSTLAKEMSALGIRYLEVNLQGPGAGRDSVVRAFQSSGLSISVLRDVTPLPHNGSRPPKKRRV